MAVGGVDHHHVGAGFRQSHGALVAGVADRRGGADQQAALLVLGGVREGLGLLDVLHRDQTDGAIVLVHDDDAFDLARAQQFARRLAPEQIYVYEVRPGVIDTPMTSVVHEKYTRMIEQEDAFPIARWGQPSDVALAISALVSGKFRYSTGEVINVDGGFHLRKL